MNNDTFAVFWHKFFKIKHAWSDFQIAGFVPKQHADAFRNIDKNKGNQTSS